MGVLGVLGVICGRTGRTWAYKGVHGRNIAGALRFGCYCLCQICNEEFTSMDDEKDILMLNHSKITNTILM